ncbi:MAG: efflux RND transporter periplasmic adaptor subunit [Paludibacter sp.]|nr:efflux RND transporter periplasmic adaptor subunit [Paludibacter sp.]
MKHTLILTLTAIAVIVTSCKKKADENTDQKQKFVITDMMLKTTTFAKAELKTLKNEAKFYGKISADNNKLIEIYPVVGGNVVKVYVELGDYVKKGQLLATIRSTQVAGYEKDMSDAENDVVVAKNNLKTAQELYEGKLNTERDVLTAKSELTKAQSQLARIRETYKIYNLKPGAIYEVRSPITGFILEKNINQDMLLRDDHTNNIFDVAEIDEVWAIANVSESDVQDVVLGANADVTTLSYPDKSFHGVVDKIFNFIDPETKAMKVRIKLKNPDFILKPEMKATIKLSYDQKEKMLAVPSSSVIFDKSKNFVMVYKGKDNIETRKVDVFRQVGDVTYITAGITEGETVITTNELQIYDALND